MRSNSAVSKDESLAKFVETLEKDLQDHSNRQTASIPSDSIRRPKLAAFITSSFTQQP